MDFDDLDDETEKRVSKGEDVLGHVVLSTQAKKGEVLRKIKRSRKVPDDWELPEHVLKTLPPEKERKPVLRLLCFYGGGDSVTQEWAAWARQGPPSIEMATYEYPGHGRRSNDAFLGTLDELVDDAFDGLRQVMSEGAFAFLGHSIGTLIMTGVARRAKLELGVEPVAAFVLERGPPHMAVLSEYGLELLDRDLRAFLPYNAPELASQLAAAASPAGRQVASMWQSDMHLERDVREVGWHKYTCPIHAFIAWSGTGEEYAELEQLPEAERAWKTEWVRHRDRQEPKGKVRCVNFDPAEFAEWGQWTEHPKGCILTQVAGTDHYQIKENKEVRKAIWDELQRIIATF